MEDAILTGLKERLEITEVTIKRALEEKEKLVNRIKQEEQWLKDVEEIKQVSKEEQEKLEARFKSLEERVTKLEEGK